MVLENGAALFKNGCSTFKLEDEAAPFRKQNKFENGAQQIYLYCKECLSQLSMTAWEIVRDIRKEDSTDILHYS